MGLDQAELWGMSIRNHISFGSNLASVMDLKRIQTPYSLSCDFGGDKTFASRWSGGSVQVWLQLWAPAGHLVIWQSLLRLFQKVIEGLEGTHCHSGQNQQLSSLTCCLALLGRVLASTNTRCFLVSCSLLAATCLRKTCYHSCDTDSVQKSTRF